MLRLLSRISLLSMIVAACATISLSIGCSADATSPGKAPRIITIPQISELTSDFATDTARRTFRRQVYDDVITPNLALPLSKDTEQEWERAFYVMELSLYRTHTGLKSLRSALLSPREHTDSFLQSAMEAVWTLYRTEFVSEMGKVAMQTKNPKTFAMAASYVVMNKPQKAAEYYKLSLRDFPDERNEAILRQLRLTLQKPFSEQIKRRPPLRDLLSYKFPDNLPVAFSFQRQDRDFPGLIVVRKQDGAFLRRPDGSLFNVPQIARSIGNYPGYLTDGNTPQGVFSMQRIKVFGPTMIGPTPGLTDYLPFEASVARFFFDPARETEKWSMNTYNSLLPPSWRDYGPIHEAYAAGEIGRNEMVAHGTTKDSEFYKGQPYYPSTPTHGCLSTLELWSGDDGHCIYSDQLALATAFASTGEQRGYVVVVDLDAEKRPVELYDVLMEIIAAEGR